MTDTAPAPPRTIVANIEQIVRIEEAATKGRSLGERVGEVVGGFAGTLAFVVAQFAAVAAWIGVNSGLLPGVTVFDPFPYALGGEILSLEGVLLAAFVLMKQAYEGRMSERRSHLNLQVNLLMEKEVTKLIQMMERMSAADGTAHRVTDEETRELAEDTALDHLAQELDRRLDR